MIFVTMPRGAGRKAKLNLMKRLETKCYLAKNGKIVKVEFSGTDNEVEVITYECHSFLYEVTSLSGRLLSIVCKGVAHV